MFSHHDKLLLALLLKLYAKEKHRQREYQRYEQLLPSEQNLEWLYFMLSLSVCLNSNKKSQKIDFLLEEGKLVIMIEEQGHLCRACVEKLQKIAPLEMKIGLKSST